MDECIDDNPSILHADFVEDKTENAFLVKHTNSIVHIDKYVGFVGSLAVNIEPIEHIDDIYDFMGYFSKILGHKEY